MKLSVVLPARNEEQLIEKSLKETIGYLKKKKYPFEILVVVNGTVDRTEEIVRRLSTRYPQIKLLKSKAGYGFALRKGMRYAKGEYVIIFNVDFYDFRLVDLVDKNMNDNDIIVGSKLARGSKDKRPVPRRLVSRLFNVYLKIMYGFKGTDSHGIKIIKQKTVRKVLPKCKTSSGIFDTEFVIRSQRMGFKTSEIPVFVAEKRGSRFVNRLFDTPIDIIRLFRVFR